MFWFQSFSSFSIAAALMLSFAQIHLHSFPNAWKRYSYLGNLHLLVPLLVQNAQHIVSISLLLVSPALSFAISLIPPPLAPVIKKLLAGLWTWNTILFFLVIDDVQPRSLFKEGLLVTAAGNSVSGKPSTGSLPCRELRRLRSHPFRGATHI